MGKNRTGGIVRIVQDDHARARRDRLFQFRPRDTVRGELQFQVNGYSPVQANGRVVTVVGRIEEDHFIVLIHHSRDRRINGLCPSGRNRYTAAPYVSLYLRASCSLSGP